LIPAAGPVSASRGSAGLSRGNSELFRSCASVFATTGKIFVSFRYDGKTCTVFTMIPPEQHEEIRI
jgi:hypothetical protein